MAKILVIDDDEELLGMLKDWLVHNKYTVDCAASGEDGSQLLELFPYDLIILDWSLPGKSGLEVCKDYRANGGHTPIIFLTGKTDIENREAGLDSGGDDYLVKPFDVRELSARIRSLLRRPFVALANELKVGDMVLDPSQRTATANDATVHLKPKECSLLEFLMRHPDQPFSAKELLDAVWSAESDASTDSVRTWVKLLRRQLSTIGKQDLIKTVLGSGYVLETK